MSGRKSLVPALNPRYLSLYYDSFKFNYNDHVHAINIAREIAPINADQIIIKKVFYLFTALPPFSVLLYTGNPATNARNRYKNMRKRGRGGRFPPRQTRTRTTYASRSGLVARYITYIPSSVKKMQQTIQYFARNSSPYALPQCIKAIANAKIADERLKADLIKYAIKALYSMVVTNTLREPPTPKIAKATQTGTQHTDVVHAELDVMTFINDDIESDTTRRTNTLACINSNLQY